MRCDLSALKALCNYTDLYDANALMSFLYFSWDLNAYNFRALNTEAN